MGYKVYSFNYLMSLKKSQIIDLLRVAEHNYFVAEESFNNAVNSSLDLYVKYEMAVDLLKVALDVIKGIADRERETYVDDLCCGYCEYDSPFTESGDMLYECPGCECNDCFKWKFTDDVLNLLEGV